MSLLCKPSIQGTWSVFSLNEINSQELIVLRSQSHGPTQSQTEITLLSLSLAMLEDQYHSFRLVLHNLCGLDCV